MLRPNFAYQKVNYNDNYYYYSANSLFANFHFNLFMNRVNFPPLLHIHVPDFLVQQDHAVFDEIVQRQSRRLVACADRLLVDQCLVSVFANTSCRANTERDKNTSSGDNNCILNYCC